ncbi:MAG: hypothetical protein M3R55_14265 [Acidobacteriota bacterium]|nr:hypothetical protein [Acidobacteriota bacterium]
MPFGVGLLAFAVFLLLWRTGTLGGGGTLADPVGAAVAMGLSVGILAAAVILAGAWPGVYWMMRRRPLSFRRMLLFGCALGNLPFFVIILGIIVVNGATVDVARFWSGWSGFLIRAGLGIVAGTFGAALFWVVAIRGTELSS